MHLQGASKTGSPPSVILFIQNWDLNIGRTRHIYILLSITPLPLVFKLTGLPQFGELLDDPLDDMIWQMESRQTQRETSSALKIYILKRRDHVQGNLT